jgi:predicted oxidoreductase
MLTFNINHYAKLYQHAHMIGQYPRTNHTAMMLDESLKEVSLYLDDCGMRMDAPKYPYYPDDVTTWKWIQKPKGHKSSCWYIKNPDCIYADI